MVSAIGGLRAWNWRVIFRTAHSPQRSKTDTGGCISAKALFRPASSVLQQHLPRVEHKPGEASDHGAVEPDELQIFSDIGLDQLDR
jgi:hypothetical protein